MREGWTTTELQHNHVHISAALEIDLQSGHNAKAPKKQTLKTWITESELEKELRPAEWCNSATFYCAGQVGGVEVWRSKHARFVKEDPVCPPSVHLRLWLVRAWACQVRWATVSVRVCGTCSLLMTSPTIVQDIALWVISMEKSCYQGLVWHADPYYSSH
jgi:hypothetical protein